MAAQRKGSRGKLSPDELLEGVDPEAIAEAQALTGFLGSSAEGGKWRLYTSPALDEYVEFREEDVVTTYKPETEGAGSIVWVKREAPVSYVSTGSLQRYRDFLTGSIVGRFVGGGVFPGGLGGIGGLPYSVLCRAGAPLQMMPTYHSVTCKCGVTRSCD
jgi:hypothetical protein